MSEDLRQLRAVMRQAISASGVAVRHVEAAMGCGHGNIERILDGRIELRVRHVVGLARLLKVPPGDFLELGFPQPDGAAKFRLKDWIMPAPFGPPNAAKKTNGPAEDIPALVRNAVQEALGTNLKETIRTVVREEIDGKPQK